MTRGLVHVFNPAGHRASYRDFLSSRLDLEAVTGQIDAPMACQLIGAKQLLFATISSGTSFKALLIALLRAGMGKRTAAICIGDSWYLDSDHPLRTTATRWLFRTLNATGLLKVFTIIPYEISGDGQRMTSDWILDLCLWDLPPEVARSPLPQTELAKRVRAAAGKRAVVVFLGRAAPRKGYSELVKLSRMIGSQALIVSAGLVSEECRRDAATLLDRDMVVEDRRISDDELISLYGIADYVWCRYDKVSSSRSSGVFGRAVQLGRTAIVQRGSYLDRLAALLGHPVIHDLEADGLAEADRSRWQQNPEGRFVGPQSTRLSAMAEASLSKLAGSL